MEFEVSGIYKEGYSSISFDRASWNIPSGSSPAGTVTLNTPVPASELWGIVVELCTYENENAPKRHLWQFFRFSEPEPSVWMNHVSHASLVDGKSDYSDAEFVALFMDWYDNGTMAEAKYFTGEGRLNIPGGGYTLMEANSDDILGTVDTGIDMSFKLNMTRDIYSDYLEYVPVDDSGNWIEFAGGAETGLNGRTVTLTFPDELNMDTRRVVPNFKSTSEQLATCVPYIELITENGNIMRTAILQGLTTALSAHTIPQLL